MQALLLFETLLKRYEKNVVLRALAQLVPLSVGSALDAALLTKLQQIHADRAREFFDALESGSTPLKPELLESNDFLHCFFATSKAALRTYRVEKIQAFARLLNALATAGKFSGVDEYEEYLGILDDLSSRELAVLTLLDQYESKFPKNADENDLGRANRFWNDFCIEMESSLAIPAQEIDAVLTRLNRSGCYETFTGNYWDYTGGKGKITATFCRLKSLALDPRL